MLGSVGRYSPTMLEVSSDAAILADAAPEQTFSTECADQGRSGAGDKENRSTKHPWGVAQLGHRRSSA